MRCPFCDSDSRDEEFCDHCNRELPARVAVGSPAPAAITLKDGTPVDLGAWSGRWPEDSDRAHSLDAGARSLRVYGFSSEAWSRRRDEILSRASISLSCLTPIEVVEVDGGAVVVADRGVESAEISFAPREYQGDWPTSLHGLSQLLEAVAAALADLHDAGFVWLNFDPFAIEADDSSLRFANLDTTVFRSGECPPTLRVSPLYSPPEVCSFFGERIGPQTDVFHLGAFAYYALAGLPNGFAGDGLAAFSHAFPPLRTFQPHLPPGVAPVIARATAFDPAKRYADVREFAEAFAEAAAEASRRYSPRPVSEESSADVESSAKSLWERATDWLAGRSDNASEPAVPLDIASACIAGCAKSALGAPNQDSVVFGPLAARATGAASCYLVVADGVTHAKAGAGEIASRRACDAIEAALLAATPTDDGGFQETIVAVVREGSVRLVEEALATNASTETPQAESPDEPPALSDADLMSSTLVVATWDGDRLRLANLGDSRAYLVTERYVDQLTVDGDVGSTLLAAGAAPEEVRGMGAAAKALQRCFGAAKTSESGALVADDERCTPRFATFPTLPGEIVLLCSDGLVDEGIFLDPADVYGIVRERADAPLQKLADALVAAADERQRLPSAAEPRGFGDNIACVILRISSQGDDPASSVASSSASDPESESHG